jgi:hypothetical protein
VNYYGMDTDTVQSVGKQVYGLHPDASSAVDGVLNSYSDASGVVHHPLVSSAMAAYRDTHQKSHLQFPEAVKALGSNTASGGRAIADASNDSSAVLSTTFADQQGLKRQLNQPLES